MLCPLGLALVLNFTAPAVELKTALIPWPEKVTFKTGALTVGKGTALVVDPKSRLSFEAANTLNEYFAKDNGMALPSRQLGQWRGTSIRFIQSGSTANLGTEGYRLVVNSKGIVVEAPTATGLFYGAQTIRQLVGRRFPAKVPFCEIVDQPRFGWRGLLLDVSRHYRDKEFVKHYLDLLAFHKMNVFHWHLVDDQGWRIQIKRYPKLTEIGAWRTDEGRRYGGFYTQDEVKEIVAYAKKRHITVVPEIEMPGHCNAALAAYPECSCTGGPFNTPSLWGVFSDVYCAGNEKTYAFNQGVLEEVLALFPSKFIHIGGDEVPKTRWEQCPKCQAKIKAEGLKNEHELQSYFIRRIDKWLADRGRRLVGWDEILEGGLAAGATVQSWRGMQGAIDAAKMGHDVIVSPTSHCYLDYPYTNISVEKSYSFEPVPTELSAQEAKRVLGGEGNMWAELTPLHKDTDRQVFPRLTALSEVYWSPKAARNWSKFSARLAPHLDTLAAMGVKFYVAPPTIETEDNVFLDRLTVVLKPTAGPIVYTLDGSEPTKSSPRYTKPLVLTQTATLTTTTLRGTAVGPSIMRLFKKTTLRAPIVFIRAPDPGLRTRIIEAKFTKLPDFTDVAETGTGVTSEIGLHMARVEENFAVQFSGYFSAPKDGIYTFYLESDDGSDLWIGDEQVIDNDGLHGAVMKTGQVAFHAGYHPIQVRFFQAGGAKLLNLEVRAPGGPRKKLEGDQLSH